MASAKTHKVSVTSLTGQARHRAGVHAQPGQPTEVEVTDEQLEALEADGGCIHGVHFRSSRSTPSVLTGVTAH